MPSPSSEVEARVREILRTSLTPKGIDQWLDAESRYLGGRRARDVMGVQPELVIAAAEAIREGVYL